VNIFLRNGLVLGRSYVACSRVAPVPVAGGLYFAQASAGDQQTCGKTPADVAYCWGDNLLGAVGDGTW
jgi:hypothetical protein